MLGFGLILLVNQKSFAQSATSGIPSATDPSTPGGKANIVKDGYAPSLRKDGAIDKEDHENYAVPWQPIREADVLMKKRLWREIDTRQKQNVAFRYPGDDESGGGMYIEILLDAIKNGKITAFSDDRFTTPMKPEDVMSKIIGEPETIEVEQADGSIIQKIINKSFDPDDITKYRLKEDWIFDKNVGRMVVRIIGLAPYLDKKNTDGSFRATVPLFWVFYPDIRGYNARFEVYNPENDVFRITWDDFFEKRHFSSYVLKSTFDNPLQDDIKNYKSGIDALLESEAIREKLFNKEHDMWVY